MIKAAASTTPMIMSPFPETHTVIARSVAIGAPIGENCGGLRACKLDPPHHHWLEVGSIFLSASVPLS
jgi:hypothetical protein